MTNALEGESAAKPSLRQEANAQRIGRARFIGHAIGVLLIAVVAAVALSIAGFSQSVQMGAQSAKLPNVWVQLGVLVFVLIAMLDLGVRRRHDRNRSGVDCAVVLMVLTGIAVGGIFSRFTPAEAMGAAGLSGLLVLYLLVTLAILPGNRGPNRYGDAPRHDD
jgi:uncharacterized membrane protein YhaH (DUF805 family)